MGKLFIMPEDPYRFTRRLLIEKFRHSKAYLDIRDKMGHEKFDKLTQIIRAQAEVKLSEVNNKED